jgi:hypothetical protein
VGKTLNLQHTPTIYVVSSKNHGKPFVEVTDDTQLYQTIEAVKAE